MPSLEEDPEVAECVSNDADNQAEELQEADEEAKGSQEADGSQPNEAHEADKSGVLIRPTYCMFDMSLQEINARSAVALQWVHALLKHVQGNPIAHLSALSANTGPCPVMWLSSVNMGIHIHKHHRRPRYHSLVSIACRLITALWQADQEDTPLCFNCGERTQAVAVIMCRGCEADDSAPNANLFCGSECFENSHSVLRRYAPEKMPAHTTRDIQVLYPLCSGPMAGCDQDFAEKHCVQCGVTACAHCMHALHSLLKKSAHQVVDAADIETTGQPSSTLGAYNRGSCLTKSRHS